MHYIFVETNWLVEFARPDVHNRNQDALDLLIQAAEGKCRLFLPHICLIQARATISRKFSPRHLAEDLRSFLSWLQSRSPHKTPPEGVASVRTFIDQYQAHVGMAYRDLGTRLASLLTHPGIEIFALTETMRQKAVELAATDLKISLSKSSYDNDILAAILIRSQELSQEANAKVSFCGLDTDLQPWLDNKNTGLPEPRQPLAGLFDDARVWVYGDFTLSQPPRPENWPPSSP